MEDILINETESSSLEDVGYNISNGYSNILFTTTLAPSSPASNATRIDWTKNVIIPAGMFFIGVLGNVTALVILSVRPSKVSRSTAFYHLVKALAVIDLLGIVILSPVTIAVYINGGVLNTGGMPLCHYFSAGLLTAGTSTLFIVLVMAAERLLVTKYPFHYGEWVTHKRVNIVIGVIVLFSIFGAILPIVGFGHNIDHWPGTWCFFDYRSSDVGSYIYSISYALVGFIVLIVTFVFNATVIKHLWRMRNARLTSNSMRSASTRTENKSFQGKQSSGPDSEKRMVIFLMAITVVFTLCYAPFMARVFINQIWNAGRDVIPGGVDDKLDIWVLRMASLNQLLDPWVYIISRFTCCSGPREKPETSHVSHYHASQRNQNGGNGQESTVKNSSRFGKSLRSVRKIFSQSKNNRKTNDKAMEPLQSSPKTSSSPLNRTPDEAKKIYTVREPETEGLYPLEAVHQPV